MGPVGVLGVKACESGEVGTQQSMLRVSKQEDMRKCSRLTGRHEEVQQILRTHDTWCLERPWVIS